MSELTIIKSAIAALLGGMGTKQVIRALNDARIYLWTVVYAKQGNYYPVAHVMNLDPAYKAGRFVFKYVPTSKQELLDVLEMEEVHYKVPAKNKINLKNTLLCKD